VLVEEAEDEELGDPVHEVRVGGVGGHRGSIPCGSRYSKALLPLPSEKFSPRAEKRPVRKVQCEILSITPQL
jgi:hypothetical protein